jgi:hypothetical protein
MPSLGELTFDVAVRLPHLRSWRGRVGIALVALGARLAGLRCIEIDVVMADD